MLARGPSRIKRRENPARSCLLGMPRRIHRGCGSGSLRGSVRRFGDRIRRQCKHRARCVSDHFFRDTPLEQTRNRRTPMRTHHDQVGADPTCERRDFARGIAEPHDNHAALRGGKLRGKPLQRVVGAPAIVQQDALTDDRRRQRDDMY